MDSSNLTSVIKHWVELYSDSMYSWAFYKTSNKEVSEDLVQDTFMVAVQTFDTFKRKSDPKTWLFAILNHKIYDHYRKNFRSPILIENASLQNLFDSNGSWTPEEKPQLWGDDTEHLLDDTEFQKTLKLCIGRLPENWSMAIHFKYLDERNSEQICQELGIATTNLWQILHRAKLHLRKCLELNWFKK